IQSLPIAQARGYVRARASAVVRQEVDQIVANGTYRGDRRTLVELATALVVRESIVRRTKGSGADRASGTPMRRAA
ncbi:MAG: hypothetical protein QGG09_04975, partial [Pirellulaceae bacterium]|nr:hypothetical protein [Pirellulaceae bacterium]